MDYNKIRDCLDVLYGMGGRCYRIAKDLEEAISKRSRIELPKKQIIEDYKNGIPCNVLADKYCVSISTMANRLKEWRVHNPRIKKMPTLKAKVIKELYWEKGYSQAKIAKILGVSSMTICIFMRENNIKARPSVKKLKEMRDKK